MNGHEDEPAHQESILLILLCLSLAINVAQDSSSISETHDGISSIKLCVQ